MLTDTSGRVLPIRGGEMLSPAVCLICRRSGSNVDETFADPSELFADPQITEDFFGSVYFCRDCSLGLAAIFGAQSNEEIADIVLERDRLLAEVPVLRSRIQDLENAIESFTRLKFSNISNVLNGSVADVPVTTPEPSTQQGLPEPVEQRADESSEPTESSSSEGPDDANELTSDDGIESFLRNL